MKEIGASEKKNAQTVRRSRKTEGGRRGRLDKKQKHALLLIAGLVLLLAAVTFATVSLGIGEGKSRAVSAPVDGIQGTKVVLDAGHGGSDAGTIGTTAGTQEAGINLKIALRLQKELENSGVQVVMTRLDEKAVAETKDLDMQKRREIISTSGQDVTIIIHQNHYEDPEVAGPQVFYAPGSAEGKKLAAAIQARMNIGLDVKSPRTEAEGNYYITKSGAAPCVIVECGFLSNPTEEQLLKKDSYQILIVDAIIRGYADYMNGGGQAEG